MIRRLLLKSLLAFLFAPLATSQNLVISALVDGPTFSLVEFTACSFIPTLHPYEFTAHSSTVRYFPFYNAYLYDDDFDTDDSRFSIEIPAGSHIYIVTQTVLSTGKPFTTADFTSFFGFTPPYLFFYHYAGFTGSETFILSIDDVYIPGQADDESNGPLLDTYGPIGGDDAGTAADFTLGWAVRDSGTTASLSFDVNDWVVRKNAFTLTTTSNLAANPPVSLGSYQCYIPSPTPAPSKLPTLRPTLAGRLPTDREPNHSRPPSTIVDQIVVAPVAPPTPAPVAPVFSPPHNPPRRKPTSPPSIRP
jgi:hypothetical protein